MKFVGNLIESHLQRYPLMALPDIYKLLHQAALGSEHLLGEPETVERKLREEIAQLGKHGAATEPLVDVISPDAKLARIDLRAYRASGRELAELSAALLRTAREYRGAPEKLAKFCACVGDLAQSGALSHSAESVNNYFAQIAAAGYPAVHHTDVYRQAYRPAVSRHRRDLLAACLSLSRQMASLSVTHERC